MKTYQEMLEKYRKRQHDTVVDTIAAGLAYVDEVAVDAGLLEEAGLIAELTDSVTGVLPFAVIAATEGTKVVLGRKPVKTGIKDGAFRMVKTGAAMGAGAAAATLTGLWAAIPTTMCVRTLFDRYKSRALTGMRVQSRIDRLHELNALIRSGSAADVGAQAELPLEALLVDGGVESCTM